MNIENVEELVVNLPDKIEYVIHIKKTSNNRLVSKKVQRVTKFNQNAKLKP